MRCSLFALGMLVICCANSVGYLTWVGDLLCECFHCYISYPGDDIIGYHSPSTNMISGHNFTISFIISSWLCRHLSDHSICHLCHWRWGTL